jgi:UTP--glucose-1-phosphate uridylyltransferase
MFPVGLHPAIEWVSAEAVNSGCADIAVVIRPGKRLIEYYLTTYCPVLTSKVRLTFLIQHEPLGLGHALALAHGFCVGQPCAVLLPDDLIQSDELPLVQMASPFEQLGGTVMGVTKESAVNAGRYGRLQLRQVSQRVFKVEGILPRTASLTAEPVLLGVGRYLLSPAVLHYAAILREQSPTGALDDTAIFQHMLNIGEPVHAVCLEGRRYDISTPDGYMAAWKCFQEKTPL